MDKLGPFADPALVFLLGVLVIGGAIVAGIGTATDLAAWTVALLIGAGTVYGQRVAARHNIILSELTAGYIISGNRILLDALLGKLIGGVWARSEIRPADGLFMVLIQMVAGEDREMKRRISEALAALAQIDMGRTFQLMMTLRDDWHEKWKSDVRRRTVEALIIPVSSNLPVMLDIARPKDIDPLLRLRDGDEIYVAMAVLEVLSIWFDRNAQSADELHAVFAADAARMYDQDSNLALRYLEEMLDLGKGDMQGAFDEVLELLESSNLEVRVAAARVAVLFCAQAPGRALDAFEKMAQDDHRYVRRPLARERCVRFLLTQADRSLYRDRIRALVDRLLLDPDDIIALTAFDMIETWSSDGKQLLRRSCATILANRAGPAELLDRVVRIAAELDEEEH